MSRPPDFDPEGEGTARAFLAAIVSSSQDAIVGKTLEGIVRSWNAGAERLFGYSAEEAIGRPIAMIIPPERHGEEREILARLRRGERIEQFDTVRVTRDGRRIEVSLTISPIRDDRGVLVGASKVAREIGSRLAAERALRQSQETLRAVIEASPVAISVMDLQGVVHLWSSAATRIFGWTAEEVVGKVAPTVPPERLPELLRNLRHTAAGHHLHGSEAKRRRKDGSLVDVELWSSTLPADAGPPDRIVSIATDITARKRTEASLRESEERFRTLADNIAQFAWMTDATGSIFWYNRRWYEFTGTDLESMKGWGWTKVHHPDHVDRVVTRFAASIESGTPWEDTFPLRGKDGEYRWFLSRAIPIHGEDGRVTMWFGTNTDITERRQMEETLRESDRRKDEFLATLAHELRNPLAPIRAGIEVLRAPNVPAEVRDRILGTLERQSQHLVRMVEDLLDVSRITRGKVDLRPRPIDLAEVIASAVEASEPVIEAAGHRLTVRLPDSPVRLHGDPTRLAQVFGNLLHNASKYMPQPGSIDVAAVVEGNEVAVSVSDTGAGIAPDLLGRVFELFVQGRDGAASGLGIGLTLVKSLVELHGGRVEVASAGPGCGSTFTVRLPLSLAEEDPMPDDASPLAPGAPSPPSRALDVLIVDDNEDAAEGLQLLLETMGHRARAVHEGASALAAIGAERPDVVLLDLGMPGMDGFETARRITASTEPRRPFLVALTGWGQPTDREKTRAAGFDLHLVKPARLEELEATLAAAARHGE